MRKILEHHTTTHVKLSIDIPSDKLSAILIAPAYALVLITVSVKLRALAMIENYS